jgi:D-lyxose ketol-isomerase
VARAITGTREHAAATYRLRLRPGKDVPLTPPVLELAGEFDLNNVAEVDRFLRRHLGPLYHLSLIHI